MPLESGTNSSSPTKYEPMGYIDWKKSPVRKSNNATLISTSKQFNSLRQKGGDLNSSIHSNGFGNQVLYSTQRSREEIVSTKMGSVHNKLMG